MIKIAICDDEEIQVNKIYTLTKHLLDKANISFNVDTYNSGESLLDNMEKGIHYDLLFLDIVMGIIDGISIGSILRKRFKNEKTLLIFISAHEMRAKEGFYCDAIRFLSKPIKDEAFEEALFFAYKKIIDRETSIYTFIDNMRIKITIPIFKIIFFETSSHHKINIITKEAMHTYYANISDLEAKFSSYFFLRIHQGYLINFDYIKEISYKEVVMVNGTVLVISAPRRKSIRKQYIELRRLRENNWL